jgi:tyrosyl-tRNA synthetase
MDAKKIVAGEVTAALHGVDAAMSARAEFVAQFSRRTFGDMQDLVLVNDASLPVVEIVKGLGWAASNGEVRRVAEQKGLRLVTEHADGGAQTQVPLSFDEARQPLAELVMDKLDSPEGHCYLRFGRRVARVGR